MRGFSASMSPGQAKKLETDPSVAYVEQNRVMTATDTQSPVPSWAWTASTRRRSRSTTRTRTATPARA